MRKLTIHRQKSFVASLMKVKIYITDPVECDLEINREKCRKLGELKNGETKEFDIGSGAVAVYAIYDTLAPNFCFGKYELSCSDDNITITGKSTFAPKKGNPFVFL